MVHACGCVQIAIKCNQLGVLYMSDNMPLEAALAEDGRIEGVQFVQTWKALQVGRCTVIYNTQISNGRGALLLKPSCLSCILKFVAALLSWPACVYAAALTYPY